VDKYSKYEQAHTISISASQHHLVFAWRLLEQIIAVT